MARPRSFSSEDREIAARLRWVRAVLGRTRPELAEVLGVSAQQILNYELGRSRISAGQLVAIGRAIKVPIGRLFGDEAAALPFSGIAVTVQLICDFDALDANGQTKVVKLMRTLAAKRPARRSRVTRGEAEEKNKVASR